MVEHYYPGKDILHGVKLELFSREDLRAINYATMDVLTNPGIQVSDADAREVFRKAGCQVDDQTQVVKIPEYIVKRALSDCPSRFTLHG